MPKGPSSRWMPTTMNSQTVDMRRTSAITGVAPLSKHKIGRLRWMPPSLESATKHTRSFNPNRHCCSPIFSRSLRTPIAGRICW